MGRPGSRRPRRRTRIRTRAPLPPPWRAPRRRTAAPSAPTGWRRAQAGAAGGSDGQPGRVAVGPVVWGSGRSGGAASISARCRRDPRRRGTATYSVFGPQPTPPSSCTSGGTTVGTAAVSGDGTYHPSTGFTPATAGDYWWFVSYGGDTRNSPAVFRLRDFDGRDRRLGTRARAAAARPRGATATAAALRSSSDPSVSGQRVTYTATISPTPDNGTVRFLAEGSRWPGATPCRSIPATAPRPARPRRRGRGVPCRPPTEATRASPLRKRHRSGRWCARASPWPAGRPGARAGSASPPAARASRVAARSAVVLSATHRRGHGRLQHVTIASTRTVRVAAGKTVTVTIKLNPAGRRLIAGLTRLPARLTLSLVVGTAHVPVTTRAVTVTAPRTPASRGSRCRSSRCRRRPVTRTRTARCRRPARRRRGRRRGGRGRRCAPAP